MGNVQDEVFPRHFLTELHLIYNLAQEEAYINETASLCEIEGQFYDKNAKR